MFLMILNKSICMSVLFCFFALTATVYGGQPLETLKPPIDKVLRILKDSQYQDASQKSLQRDIIFETVRGLFDFQIITKLALGKYRKSFTSEQLKTLTDIFTTLLGMTYINKMLAEFKNEKVIYLAEDMLTENKAVVKTLVRREKGDMAIDYSMRLRNGVWYVYDVRVEGVSLVRNYRTQFSKILFKQKPEVLIKKLQNKLKEYEASVNAQQS